MKTCVLLLLYPALALAKQAPTPGFGVPINPGANTGETWQDCNHKESKWDFKDGNNKETLDSCKDKCKEKYPEVGAAEFYTDTFNYCCCQGLTAQQTAGDWCHFYSTKSTVWYFKPMVEPQPKLCGDHSGMTDAQVKALYAKTHTEPIAQAAGEEATKKFLPYSGASTLVTYCSGCTTIANAAKDVTYECKTATTGVRITGGCAEGYYHTQGGTATANDTCTACPTNCKKCDKNGCLDCAANCQKCTSSTVCTNANAGYFLDNKVPKSCATGDSDVCKGEATNKTVKTAAQRCTEGNTLTANPGSDVAKDCAICPDGKFSNGSNKDGCSDCAANCEKCDSATKCTTAKAGYFLDTNAPKSCAANCKTCTNATANTAAKDGFALSDDKKTCDALPSNCKTGPYDKVAAADDGYFVAADNTSCTPCATGCKTCDSATIATGAKDGFYKATDNKTCPACPANSAKCTSATAITECKPGYYKKGDNTSCIACTSGCATCTSATANVTAKEGHYLAADKQSCPACVKRTLQQCQVAGLKYPKAIAKDGEHNGHTIVCGLDGWGIKVNNAKAQVTDATGCDAYAKTCPKSSAVQVQVSFIAIMAAVIAFAL